MTRVLVIDDDPLSRDYVAQILLAGGHSVEMAENAEQGLAAFQTRPIDLIITDMVMPGTDGVELITNLLKSRPNLPVIAMSGAPDSAAYLYLASYLGAGMVLTKPFAANAMLAAVTEALKKPRGGA